jgi:hypothetical protein
MGIAVLGTAKSAESDTVATRMIIRMPNLAEPGWFNREKAAMFRILSDHSDTG